MQVTTNGLDRFREEVRSESAKRAERMEARQVARENRSPSEQLRLLDQRLGKGVGADKERKRLYDQMAAGVTGKRSAGAVAVSKPVESVTTVSEVVETLESPVWVPQVGEMVRINSEEYGKTYLRKKGEVVEVTDEGVKVKLTARKNPLLVSLEHLDAIEKSSSPAEQAEAA